MTEKEREEPMGDRESEPRKRKTVSPENRRRLSELWKGEKNPNWGKDHKGEKNPHWGRKHTPEARRKMSESHKGEKDLFLPHRNIVEAYLSEGIVTVTGHHEVKTCCFKLQITSGTLDYLRC